MKINGWCLLLATAALLSVPASAPARQRAAKTAPYARYRGAWFNIDYPKGWQVRPSLREGSSPTGPTESVFFIAPDKSVEFYVFSPLWNGDPKDIALEPDREEIVSSRVGSAPRVRQAGGGYLYNPVAHWYTVRAKDHSYQRSWVDVEDKGLNVRRVFGIQYRSRQAYQKYQPQYAHFRQSLEQFSD